MRYTALEPAPRAGQAVFDIAPYDAQTVKKPDKSACFRTLLPISSPPLTGVLEHFFINQRLAFCLTVKKLTL